MRRAALLFAALASLPAQAAPGPRYTGLNIAGGEFKAQRRPGVYGKDYVYPGRRDLAYAAQAGFNAIRVPIRWERIQPALGGPLDPTNLQRLDLVFGSAAALRLTPVLDVHNYGAFAGRGPADPAVRAGLIDLWSRLAVRYRARPVIFGLMNEPKGIDADGWARIAQAALLAIRRAGARNLVLVPGVRWTGAHSWTKRDAAGSNADALSKLADPADNYAIEMHQYLDRDSSGTGATCPSPDIGVNRLRAATAWLRATRQRGFLAEFGASPDPTCLAALNCMLTYVRTNGDAWLGWTYWAAGPWWSPAYPLSVQPSKDGAERPQMAVLQRYVVR